MKFSLSWLQDHLDLSSHSHEELDHLLTFAGIEVEGVERMPDRLVVARIDQAEKHPGADKLSVCQVDDGSGKPRQIVCGASNFKPGDLVPLALPDCRLGPDFIIRKGKLRGVASDGMLCSAAELGLADAADGLLILPPTLKPGTPLHEIFPPVFDLEITPNRSDLLSHLGLARELSALTGTKLKGLRAHHKVSAPQRAARKDEIRIEDHETCPFYAGRIIRNVRVAPSPPWLQEKLQSIGLRPINNVVDITNFVLMEMGQPLHAFDLAKLDGPVVVRRAREAEPFLALDGVARTLDPSDCVIADASRAHALGGVMGGADSGVTGSTTDLLLEAAWFTPSRIRRTSHRLEIHSDSSYRFERGVDPAQTLGASELATRLIVELAGGEPDPEILLAGSLPASGAEVPLDPKHCRRLIGAEIPNGEIVRILKQFGLARTKTGWSIPSWRLDLRRPVDLIEEVARVHGLDRVPSDLSTHLGAPSKADAEYDAQRDLRDQLTALGFLECQTTKLIAEHQLEDDLATNPRNLRPIRVKNPMTDAHSWLRPALIPSLLRVAEHNVRMGCPNLCLFEIGTTFLANPKGHEIEQPHLALLITGRAEDASWQNPRPPLHDVHSLRGLLDAICGGPVTLTPIDHPRLLLAAEVHAGSIQLGILGQVHPARARNMNLNQPVLVAELNLRKWAGTDFQAAPRFAELARFPAVTRDVAIEAPASLPNQRIVECFAASHEPLLESFELFDCFTDPSGEKLAADRKSLAYTLTYRDRTDTLQSATVDAAHERLLKKLKDALPVQFR